MRMDDLSEKIREVVQKCGLGKIATMILCGILLLVLSLGGLGGSKSTKEMTERSVEKERDEKNELTTYRETVENEVEQMLSGVEGVGNAQVMLTLKASGEKVTLKDRTTEEGKSEEESVLIENENNGMSPYVVQERQPEIEGILVVCSGGDNPGVQREIIDAISALFSVESHKIKVMKSKEAK